MQRTRLPISQSQNEVCGDLAAGDIHKTSITVHAAQPVAESRLNRLYRRMAEEAHDPYLTEYIGQLQIFARVVENEEVIGIQAKLEAADRYDQVEMAAAMKEMIFAELRRNIFSRTFQQIYATLMGKVFELFITHVMPAIQNGEPRSVVDELVHVKVVLPVASELSDCPDCTDAPELTVRGMIYFLTGNCHIKWHPC